MLITVEYIDNRIAQVKSENQEKRRGQTLDVKQSLDMKLIGALGELELIRKQLVND